MASANQRPVFKDGGSNNKPPLFCGEYFDFWKIQMKAHLEAQGEEVWEAVLQGPHVPTTVVNGVGSEKPKASWDDNDRKRFLLTKRRSVFFMVLLVWMNSSEYQHVQHQRKFG